MVKIDWSKETGFALSDAGNFDNPFIRIEQCVVGGMKKHLPHAIWAAKTHFGNKRGLHSRQVRALFSYFEMLERAEVEKLEMRAKHGISKIFNQFVCEE